MVTEVPKCVMSYMKKKGLTVSLSQWGAHDTPDDSWKRIGQYNVLGHKEGNEFLLKDLRVVPHAL